MARSTKAVTTYNIGYVQRLASDRELLITALGAVAAYIRNADDYDPLLILSTLDRVSQTLPDEYNPNKPTRAKR